MKEEEKKAEEQGDQRMLIKKYHIEITKIKETVETRKQKITAITNKISRCKAQIADYRKNIQ